MRRIIICLALLITGAASAAETDVPPSAHFAIEGLDTNIGNLRTVIHRGCDSTEVNSLDRSTEAYLYRVVFVSTRQLEHSKTATKESLLQQTEQHIKNSRELSAKALQAAFDFAEISLRSGCLDLAEKYYARIVSTFIGNAFAADRQRAQAEIDKIRSQLRPPPAR